MDLVKAEAGSASGQHGDKLRVWVCSHLAALDSQDFFPKLLIQGDR